MYNKCLMYWIHLQYVFTIFKKGNNFCTFLLAYLGDRTLPKGDQAPEEKNLFLPLWVGLQLGGRLKLMRGGGGVDSLKVFPFTYKACILHGLQCLTTHFFSHILFNSMQCKFIDVDDLSCKSYLLLVFMLKHIILMFICTGSAVVMSCISVRN